MSLKRYELIQTVHSGESTTVYKARDLITGTDVAIKKLSPGTSDVQKIQFINSYRIMSGCRHPILVPVIDFGYSTTDSMPFRVMPWVDHVPLRQRSWNSEHLIQLTLQILQALVYLHRADIAYENLHTDNIFWLPAPDPAGFSIRVCNYGTPRYNDPDHDILLREAGAMYRLDLMRLAAIIDELGPPGIDSGSLDEQSELRDFKHLNTLLDDAVKSSHHIDSDVSWNLTLRLIQEFENRSYAQRPSRQVEFSEAPFLGRQNTLMELNSWLKQSGPGAVLLFGSLAWMGRYRVLRHWLPEVRINGRVVIELDRHADLSLSEWFAGKPLGKTHTRLAEWLDALPSALVVVHREALEDQISEYIPRIFNDIRRRGWQIIVSLNDQCLDHFQNRGLIPSDNTHRIWLPPISFSDTCRTLAALLDSTKLNRRLQQEVHKTARGNPGLIVRIINSWIKEDLLIKENNLWHLVPEQNVPLPIPPEIQNHFRKRLQSLSPESAKLLNILALVDTPLDLTDLRAFIPDGELHETIDLLVERDVVCLEKKLEHGYGYYFSHGIIKMAVLERLSERDIRTGHLHIAEIMEQQGWPVEQTALHWLISGCREKGVRKGLEAAWMYRHQGNFIETEKWVDRLRMHLQDLPAELQGRVHYLHAEVSLLLHRHEDVLTNARLGLAFFPKTGEFSEERSFLYQYIAQIYMREGQFDLALSAVRNGMEELKGEHVETAVTLRVMCGVLFRHQGRYDDALRELQIARKEMDKIQNDKSRASAKATILNLQSTIQIDKGEIEAARESIDRAIRISDDNTFTFYRALLRNKRADLESSIGNLMEAEPFIAEAMRISGSTGMPSEKATAMVLNGNIAVHRGQFEDAERYYDRALVITETLRRRIQSDRIRRLQARMYRLTGRFAEARKVLQDLSDRMVCSYPTPSGVTLQIEAGMLDLSSAHYTSALRHLTKAVDFIRRMRGHRHEAWAQYGLAQAFWRLNHLNRTKNRLIEARQLAEQFENNVLLAWICLLEARLARLDRNREGFRKKMVDAERLFRNLGNEPGRLAVRELELRDIIDKDLSQSIWEEAVNLWEAVRRTGAWQHVVGTAITLSRLGVRRGNFIQISGILDAAIGMARERGCREELWRLLRIRAQSLQEQGFLASARESLMTGITIINDICRDIRSPVLRRTYRSRYDVQNMRQRLQAINRHEATSYTSFTALPSLSTESDVHEKRTFVFTSEHNRLLRQAVRRFRHHLEPEDLMDDLLDVVLKLTGADRAIVYLRHPGEDTYRIGTIRRIGMAPDIDGKLIRSSALFAKVIDEKSSMFSHNIQSDKRFSDTMIGRHLGARSVLLSPMRAARDIAGIVYLDIRSGSEEMLAANTPLVQELADEAALSLEISGLYKDLDDTFMSMVRALGTTVDAKDEYTHGHAARVAEYALMIGREMGLSQEDLRDLEIGAYLHDIGKIGIAGVILKSRDKLTDSEMEVIRHHPEIGTRILSPIRKLSKVAMAIRQHHERYDGTGYPDQLKGEEILLIARIIAVADALDAMTTVRPYQTPMTIREAVDVISRNAGTQFDPQVARVAGQLFQKGRLTGS